MTPHSTDPRVRIGVDVGGTKIEAIALAASGAELARRRVSTPRDYAASLDAIVAIIAEIEHDVGATATVGLGIPGAVVPATGLVKNANSVWLNGRALGRDLERRLAREVRLMNDANCFALSEATDGAAAGASIVFGAILGTGVGGGIVIDGRCLEGIDLITGEWGHNPLPWPRPDETPGAECYCGKRGCIETFLSGPALERDHARVAHASLAARDIVRAAESLEPDAVATMERYHDRLARALASIVNVLDPEVIVLGGGMSNIPGLAEAATALLPRYVFSDVVATRVVRALHGDSSGVRGAAWLWPARADDDGARGAATLAVRIARDVGSVYDYLSDPANLREWAAGLCLGLRPDGDGWLLETASGAMRLRFTERNAFGVLDHWVRPVGGGGEVYVPMRVVPHGEASEVQLTILRAHDVTDEQFARDRRAVETDLARLRAILER